MKVYAIIKNDNELIIYNKSLMYIIKLCEQLKKTDTKNQYGIIKKYVDIKEG